MAVQIHLESNADDLVRRFRRLPGQVQAGIRNGLAGALLVLEGRVKQSAAIKWRRGAAGLAGRLTSFARLGGTTGIDAAIGFRRTSGFPYELAQEYGAKARHGGAMAIPVSREAKQASERGVSARRFERTLILVKTRDKAVLMEPRKRSLILHYVLMKSIPPRLKFRETVFANVPALGRAIVAGYQRGVETA